MKAVIEFLQKLNKTEDSLERSCLAWVYRRDIPKFIAKLEGLAELEAK